MQNSKIIEKQKLKIRIIYLKNNKATQNRLKFESANCIEKVCPF